VKSQRFRRSCFLLALTIIYSGYESTNNSPAEPSGLSMACMSNHYLFAFVLRGKTSYPLFIEDCEKRGKELPVSRVLLLYLALAIFDILIYSLHSSPGFFRKVLNGIKPTWKNIFSQLDELLFEGIFSPDCI